MFPAALRYREFAPCEALRAYVRTFFSFGAPAENDAAGRLITREVQFGPDDPFCSPMFADGHVSIVFSFATGYRVDGLWNPNPAGPRGHVIGAMTVGRPSSLGEGLEMFGVYLRGALAPLFTHVPACELTDRIVALEDLWGAELEMRLREANGTAERIGCLESALLARMVEGPKTRLDVAGLAAWVLRRRGRLTVERMADAAGVSRQHLTRAFRESVGVTPKLYCRLARFRAGLAHTGGDWADVALELGYADQSHMIAEYREFSGLTPGTLTTQRYFHPFLT